MMSFAEIAGCDPVRLAACAGRVGAGTMRELAEARLKLPDGAASGVCAAGAGAGTDRDEAEARLKLDGAGSGVAPGRDFGIGTAAATCSAVSCCGAGCCGTTEAVTRREVGRAISPSSSSPRTLREATTVGLDFDFCCFCEAGLLEATCVSGPFDMMRASCVSGIRGQCRTLPTSM